MPPLLESSSAASLAEASARPAEADARDRRAHERLSPYELAWLKSVRLKFGPSVSLVDLSAGGVQFETTTPLRPGSTIDVTITGRGLVQTVSLYVLRCQISRIEKGPVYRGAGVFDRSLTLPQASGPQASPAQGDAAHARSANALGGTRPRLRLIRTEDLRTDTRPVDALAGWQPEPGTAPLAMDAPGTPLAVSEGRPGSSVKDRDGCVQAIDDVRSAVGREPADETACAARVAAPGAAATGWNRLVVRYMDGRMMKGFSHDFHASRAHFHLTPTAGDRLEAPVLVPLAQLKAVFYVRDFSGDPHYVARHAFAGHLPGRRIEITFLDDEVLVGTTLGYKPDGTGFFVTPADPHGNNVRVFVLPAGVRHIRYL